MNILIVKNGLIMSLISVKRHAVGLHADLPAYICKNLFILLASFLCLAGDQVKMVCGICQYLVDKVHVPVG